jgi:hypothetical protein
MLTVSVQEYDIADVRPVWWASDTGKAPARAVTRAGVR